jgi:hypothetical protein
MNGRMGAVAGADVRKTRNQEPIDWRRILERIIETLLIAAVISLVGIVINMHTEVRILQDRLNGSAHESRSEGGQGASQQPTNGGSNPGSGHDSVKPEELCPIIERQQRTHVKESFGEWASESFTEDDLRRFQEQDIPRRITNELKRDNTFISVVLAIQALPPNKRQSLLEACTKPLHPTWAQLGKISPEGQTDAGQKAEIMIATAVVDLVKTLVRLPRSEIEKLYT